jgi:uncharacterized protein YndB with AHSA1/START domain
MDDTSVTKVDTGPDQVSYRTTVDRPAAELFGLLADPYQHHVIDGSGTVNDTTAGPQRLSEGAKFSVKMKQFGMPYKITSRVTQFEPDRLIEWRHPMGHRWRWSFEPVGDDPGNHPQTVVTETFDFSGLGPRAAMLKLTRFDQKNGEGIRNTLTNLHTLS